MYEPLLLIQKRTQKGTENKPERGPNKLNAVEFPPWVHIGPADCFAVHLEVHVPIAAEGSRDQRCKREPPQTGLAHSDLACPGVQRGQIDCMGRIQGSDIQGAPRRGKSGCELVKPIKQK